MKKTVGQLSVVLIGATAFGANEKAYLGQFPSSDGKTNCGIFLDKEGNKSGPTYESLIALVQRKPEASANVLRFLNIPPGSQAELALYRMAFRTPSCGTSIPNAAQINPECEVVKALVSDLNNVVYRFPMNGDGRTQLFPAECVGAVDVNACARSSGPKGRSSTTTR
jgi:hypothetical protein